MFSSILLRLNQIKKNNSDFYYRGPASLSNFAKKAIFSCSGEKPKDEQRQR